LALNIKERGEREDGEGGRGKLKRSEFFSKKPFYF
jgi:hypothetical protein